jgi:glycosyltransferase involved in cell wall biosynthesis
MNARARPDVLIVAGDFVLTGGMDRANYALADYLSREGRAVELVAHRAAPELVSRALVTFRSVPKPLGSYALGEPFLDRLGRRAARRARASGARVIVNGGNCIARGVNWVHYVHAAYAPERPRTLAGVRRWLMHLGALRQERAALRAATRVVANSHATRRVLVERLGVPAERAVVVYYGVDATRFSPIPPGAAAFARARLGWPDRPTVAFIGALGDRRKGFDTLFEAWCELCKSSSWDADLVAIGTGAELGRFRERALSRGLAQRVRLLGFRDDVDQLLGACDALVAPTRYEAFGLGVAEALARGLPALVSRAAGVAELYPAELSTCLLDDPESASELVARLRQWRANLDDLRDAVRPLSERVRGRSWDDMAREVAAELSRG